MARKFSAPAVIDNPTAYADAIQRRIKENARTGRRRRFEAAYPGLRQRILDDSRALPTWVADTLFEWGGLTEKQAAFALAQLDRSFDRAWDEAHAEQERRANTAPWAAGRQIVTGTIVTTKSVAVAINAWHSTSSLKALIVTPEQRKLWVTVPSAVPGTAEEMKGKTITITVTVKPKDSDPTFAFGSRPILHTEAK